MSRIGPEDSPIPNYSDPEESGEEAVQEQAEEEEGSSEAVLDDEPELTRPWLKHYPGEVEPTLVYPGGSIAQFLLDAVNRYPTHPAVHFMGKTLTYRDIHTDAVRLASNLAALGVQKGDRVAIMLPNCPQAVVSYYGVLLSGGIVVQTNPLYVERELQHQLKDCGASAIITLDLLYDRLARVRGEEPDNGPVPDLKHVIITSIKDGLPFPKSMLYPIKQRKEGFRSRIPYGRLGVRSYRKLMSGRIPSVELPPLAQGDELAALQYTGGTTGTPKGVMLSHGNFVANTCQIAAWCYKAEEAKENFLAALPLFQVFGLTVLMNLSVMRAGTLTLLPRFETDTVLRTIREQRPTIFPGAPTMYVALINHARSAEMDLTSINICISGSAALPLEVQEQFEALTGGRLIEGYGLSEAAPVTHANPIWGHRKIGTIGLPLPDTDAAVIDPVTGKRLQQGELGELVVRGPQVMQGYWNRPQETAQTLQDGWLRTGDLATMDEDGYFIIMDRIKDVIIAGGFNVYPREVEEVLYEHPAVREAAVIGVKDDYRGETVKACIVLKEGWQVSRSQLDKWCRTRLAAYKVPNHYTFRETLPKTMVGKVLRRKLIEEETSTEAAADQRKE
ncbi:long-chain-fatty-acid--CoA ligase [Paenibacillus chungangensis]|uniref:Long-chain fatty acid--CoA ligase n=1 Tax=Paenibacillus chungangensis TaxID=696535 RepID=A0ABW3HRI8_9BACL